MSSVGLGVLIMCLNMMRLVMGGRFSFVLLRKGMVLVCSGRFEGSVIVLCLLVLLVNCMSECVGWVGCRLMLSSCRNFRWLCLGMRLVW